MFLYEFVIKVFNPFKKQIVQKGLVAFGLFSEFL